MRISDWSSDVCSSDLAVSGEKIAPNDLLQDLGGPARNAYDAGIDEGAGDGIFGHVAIAPEELQALVHNLVMQVGDRQLDLSRFDWREFALEMARDAPVGKHAKCGRFRRQRSEAHTSELQSLMRTSYAVFCLKKKK